MRSDFVMNFVGRAKARSSFASIGNCVAPGERNIHDLNLQREEKIREMMGWRRLEPGSLNLCVNCEVVGKLLGVKELLFEPPCEINYPRGWQHIPNVRGGYKYYMATATAKCGTQAVLVRRAATRPIPGLVELFSDVNLRERFSLRDGDEVEVAVFHVGC